jgi:glycosyltransferase involved in cell wall biosynthesis
MALGADDRSVTPLHVAVVNLAFEGLMTASDLLARYRLLTDFCSQLAASGLARVSVLGRFRRDEDLERGGVRYYFRADAPDRLRASPLTRPVGLYRLLHQLAPDVVHVNGFVFPAQVAEMRWRLPSATALVVQHRGDRPHGTWLKWAQRATRSCIDGFLFSVDGIADEWRASGAVGPRQPVLPVLGNSSTLRPVARGEARRDTGMFGEPALLWVGRLHWRKDPRLAFDAFDRARASLPDPQLFVVFQEDPLLSDLRALCASRPGLAERVHFVGAVPHEGLARWFSAADLFITTSPAEGSNVALVDALACGLMPVCSDNPANRFATGSGEAGVLFLYGDTGNGAEAIVEAAARVARDGEAGRARLRAHFDAHLGWPVVARQAVSAYRTVIAARQEGRRPRYV